VLLTLLGESFDIQSFITSLATNINSEGREDAKKRMDEIRLRVFAPSL